MLSFFSPPRSSMARVAGFYPADVGSTPTGETRKWNVLLFFKEKDR